MMLRTIKVKANLPKEIMLPLLKTSSEVFNIYIDWAFSNNSHSKSKANKALYEKIRKDFPNLPSGLVQTIRDMAMESVKGTKFKFKPHKKETSGIRFDKRNSSLRGNLLTLSTLDKRVKTLISVPKYFQDIFDTWKYKGTQLIFRKDKQQFFVCLNFEIETPIPAPGFALGIDRGLKNIISCSNGYEVSGKTRNKIKRKRSFQRKELQAKGTRSAKHRKRCLGGREKRFSLNENHVIAKEIVRLPYQHFILEKLSKMNKKNAKRKKSFKRKISNWSYYQLEMMLKYKAEALGKSVEYVNPQYTSQRCNSCGHIAQKNRNGDVFKCIKCGYEDGADRNAAKNIRDLWLISLIPERAGCGQSPEYLPSWQKPARDPISLGASPLGS